jgi:CTP synthase (UTP-ammonia lyase)
VAGVSDAGHMEMEPDTESPLFILASCPVDNRTDGTPRLWGELEINLTWDSLAYEIYGKTKVYEPFQCNYELNPDYRQQLESSGIKVSGVTSDGGTRIVEITGHPFFIGTGFVPQMISTEDNPHPLITAFLRAVIDQ